MAKPNSRPETKVADPADPSAHGRFAYEGLERIIHEKARLGIMTSLASHPGGLLFNDLKDLCTLTDGNLSRHLQALHEEGLVEIWKSTRRNRSQTLCRLTPEGRERFLHYISVLESVVADALAAAAAQSSPSPNGADTRLRSMTGLAEGWYPA